MKFTSKSNSIFDHITKGSGRLSELMGGSLQSYQMVVPPKGFCEYPEPFFWRK